MKLNKLISRKTLNQIIWFRSLFRKFHSLNQIDKKLSLLLKNKGGFYIEIGANDGISQSNSLFFERRKKWKGILVEPSPVTFDFLKSNRNPSNTFFNCACVSFDFKDSFIEFNYSNLMSTTVHSKNDSDKNKVHSESGYLYLAKNEKPEKINVPAFTLEYLLDKCKAPPLIDFFSLDVEGNELEVLKGLSHIKYRFKYIVVETSDFENVSAFLSLKNYQYIRRLSVHDYLFKDLGV